MTGYSMYDAWEDYRFGVAYSLVGAVAAAGAPGLDAQADPAAWCALLSLSLVMTHRCEDARAADVAATDATPGLARRRAAARERLRRAAEAANDVGCASLLGGA